MAETLTKIRFELDVSDWHGHGSETLWAMPIPQTKRRNFLIRNSPFFAKGINYLDVVTAKPTENNMVFDFMTVIKRGGHSTFMLLMETVETCVAAYWNLLEMLGCSYESMQIDLSIGKRTLYSVDVPPTADVREVYKILERGEGEAVWLFQEGYANIPTSRAV